MSEIVHDKIHIEVKGKIGDRSPADSPPYSLTLYLNDVPTKLVDCNFEDLYDMLHQNVFRKPFTTQTKCWYCKNIGSSFVKGEIIWKTSFPHSGYKSCHKLKEMPQPSYEIGETYCPLKYEIKHFVYHFDAKEFREELRLALEKIKHIYREYCAKLQRGYSLDEIEKGDAIVSWTYEPSRGHHGSPLFDSPLIHYLLWKINAEIAIENIDLGGLSGKKRAQFQIEEEKRLRQWRALGEIKQKEIEEIDRHNAELVFLKNESITATLVEQMGDLKSTIDCLLSTRDHSELVKIEYSKFPGDVSLRAILPEAIVYRANMWYVIAFCTESDECRTFRIDRIQSAENTHETMESQNCAIEAKQKGTFPKREVNREGPSLDAPPPIEWPMYFKYDDADLNEECLKWRPILDRADKQTLNEFYSVSPFVADKIFQSDLFRRVLKTQNLSSLKLLLELPSFRGYFDDIKLLLVETIKVKWVKAMRYLLNTYSDEINIKENAVYIFKRAPYSMNVKLLKELVEVFGIDPNAQNALGETVLQLCTEARVDDEDGDDLSDVPNNLNVRSYACVRYLLKQCHANPNLCNNIGWTPLFYAAVTGQIKKVKYLLKYGADVNILDVHGFPVLHYLLYGSTSSYPRIGDYDEIVDLLIKHGARIYKIIVLP